MPTSVTPFLMFQGQVAPALEAYAQIFPSFELIDRQLYGPGEVGAEGTVREAAFAISGQRFRCIDSYIKHAFDFTPSFSIFVECGDLGELERLVESLGEGGTKLMPPDDYGFSKRFAWLNDRFGVSWQLNVAAP